MLWKGVANKRTHTSEAQCRTQNVELDIPRPHSHSRWYQILGAEINASWVIVIRSSLFNAHPLLPPRIATEKTEIWA